MPNALDNAIAKLPCPNPFTIPQYRAKFVRAGSVAIAAWVAKLDARVEAGKTAKELADTLKPLLREYWKEARQAEVKRDAKAAARVLAICQGKNPVTHEIGKCPECGQWGKHELSCAFY